jgi:Holliday junction resolvase-like predicted endonuclease
MAFKLPQLGIPVNPQHRFGWLGEQLAWAYFACLGYRRFTPKNRGHVQIDLMMIKGSLLLVVEVKTRRNLAEALLALKKPQSSRLARAARQVAAAYPDLAVRADAVLVFPRWPLIHHVAGAIDA